MTNWTLRSLFGIGGARNRAGSRKIRRKNNRRQQRADTSLTAESLEQRTLLAVVAPAYEVVNDWGSGFEATVELQNLDSRTVDNWTVSFDYAADISSIWNASIIARDSDTYTISNAGWNASLRPGQSVGFGFIGTSAAGTERLQPTNYLINGEAIDGVPSAPEQTPDPSSTPDPTVPVNPTPVNTAPVNAELTATFSKVSDWESGFTGEVMVRNGGSTTLQGWTVTFNFPGEIDPIWNAEVVSHSGSTYVVRGANWNADLVAGAETSFGFNATPGGATSALSNFLISGVQSAPQPPAAMPTPMPLPSREPVADPAPGPVSQPSDSAGRVFPVNPAGADIVGFNPSVDRLDFGDISVHNLILGKTGAGKVAIMNPWAWTPECQVLQGISYTDLTIENFGVVGNEHLRQDIGGVLSWELGVGPREANTIYVRSHEYDVQERIENFDPATMKLSFLYFGTRERLSVEDTDDGVLIAVQSTAQSILLVDVRMSDLVPANIEFHHDQVVEDRLEEPFGLTVDQLSIVSRTNVDPNRAVSDVANTSPLLTPAAPDGQITDGYQVIPGSGSLHIPTDGGHDTHPSDSAQTEWISISDFGMSHGSDHTRHDQLTGERTPITTEALEAYNQLRNFLGLSEVNLAEVGTWAFANELTNNSQAWGNDLQGVGLWYAMQGAKVGWIRDDAFDPQILADIQRTARLGSASDVLVMVREFGHIGFADYLKSYGGENNFINTLKMEPHFAGWMHDRAHGGLSIAGVATAHDVNHLTVLSHDQTRPFMNDTFDWPQWAALEVPLPNVIEYFQSMIVLGNPVGENIVPRTRSMSNQGTTGSDLDPPSAGPNTGDNSSPTENVAEPEQTPARGTSGCIHIRCFSGRRHPWRNTC